MLFSSPDLKFQVSICTGYLSWLLLTALINFSHFFFSETWIQTLNKEYLRKNQFSSRTTSLLFAIFSLIYIYTNPDIVQIPVCSNNFFWMNNWILGDLGAIFIMRRLKGDLLLYCYNLLDIISPSILI